MAREAHTDRPPEPRPAESTMSTDGRSERIAGWLDAARRGNVTMTRFSSPARW